MMNLAHSEFRALLANKSGLNPYPVYIPETASFPACMYILTGVVRDPESVMNGVSISSHQYNVVVANKSFTDLQNIVAKIINGLEQYSDEHFIIVVIEDVADGYDPELDTYTSIIEVSFKIREE